MTVMLLVDLSQSERFGSVARPKLETAVEIAALLAFSAIRNNDRVRSLLRAAESHADDEHNTPVAHRLAVRAAAAAVVVVAAACRVIRAAPSWRGGSWPQPLRQAW